MGLEWISDHAWELYEEMKYDIEEEAEAKRNWNKMIQEERGEA